MTPAKKSNNYEKLINGLFKKYNLSPQCPEYQELLTKGAQASSFGAHTMMETYFESAVSSLANSLKEEKESAIKKKKAQERAVEIATKRSIAPVRLNNSRTLMALPWFSPDQRVRTKVFNYCSQDGSIKLEVHPSPKYGAAKVWDADILMYALSKALSAYLATREFPRTVSFSAYEYLKQAQKDPGSGKNLADMKQKLDRLSLTRYKYTRINPQSALEGSGHAFGLCSASWTNDPSGRLDGISITFSDELFEHFASRNDLLSLNKNLLLEAWKEDRSGLRKRLLMLVGVHLGNQNIWKANLKTLQSMCGHDRELKYFKRDFFKLIPSLPWLIEVEKNSEGLDLITFRNTTGLDHGGE